MGVDPTASCTTTSQPSETSACIAATCGAARRVAGRQQVGRAGSTAAGLAAHEGGHNNKLGCRLAAGTAAGRGLGAAKTEGGLRAAGTWLYAAA